MEHSTLFFVGALNVGSIGLSHFPGFRTNSKDNSQNRIETDLNIKKGDEIGWFEMGSTVLILIEGSELNHFNELQSEMRIKLGERIQQS
jgi:phosphatidylserine decarboxylase